MYVMGAAVTGFFCGLLMIPISSRLLKAFGWETPFRFVNMLHMIRLPKQKGTRKSVMFKMLLLKMLIYCLLYGIVFSALFSFLFSYMSVSQATCVAAMLYIVSLSGLIDLRIWILPDFFTVPLIISGLVVTYYLEPLASMDESVLGCIFGYIMPLIVALMLQRKHENPIGGGDVKMMAGLGAWLGFVWFNVALIVSFVTFAAFAVLRKSKVCPYGPPLALATVITVVARVINIYW